MVYMLIDNDIRIKLNVVFSFALRLVFVFISICILLSSSVISSVIYYYRPTKTSTHTQTRKKTEERSRKSSFIRSIDHRCQVFQSKNAKRFSLKCNSDDFTLDIFDPYRPVPTITCQCLPNSSSSFCFSSSAMSD